ncbi:sigma-70 family RNA polymerase sigma factor [Caminicella sporogenes]|uniref:sigma-70 family RNA polymerase sigma factor n=1 Tax=Caminicella sporogenes TaxID=166485 RepID=UPI0025411EE3|nr:sigma-70 family RNA polymerase sigma factor [Caminicella sporogenes]WIF95152.1 sigma-70 family RNA polymerase sigma factor [Caminicella sporogenes]
MKRIRVNENLYKEMTFEEVLKKYEPLIGKLITPFMKQFEYDDLFQTASIALWNAYRIYEVRKKVGFGHYARVVIRNELLKYAQRHREKLKVISYNNLIFNSEKDKEVEFMELIDNNLDIEVKAINMIELERIRDKIKDMSERKQKIFQLYLKVDCQHFLRHFFVGH